MKRTKLWLYPYLLHRRKKPNTLSRIETRSSDSPIGAACIRAGKNLKPYQGLKPGSCRTLSLIHCRKKPKTLSGIETYQVLINHLVLPHSRKKPKTLSGIETSMYPSLTVMLVAAGKNLKPYQGLKPQ